MKYLILKIILAFRMNNKSKIGLLLILLNGTFLSNTFAQNKNNTFFQNEVYVKIKESIDIERSKSPDDIVESKFDFLSRKNKSEYGIDGLKASFYFSKSEELRRIFRLKFSKTEKVEDLIKVLKKSKQIEAVEKIPIFRTTTIPEPDDLGPNDDSSDGQYSLHLVNAIEAWGVTQGDPNIVVAVVDDAIQIDHEDLADNIVDGRDVADDDDDPNPPNDDFDHGTHVAGIVGAVTDNGTGIASIGNGISIMPVKATTNINDCDNCITHGWEGVIWAAENGADVINCSFGSSGPLNQEGLPSPFWQGIIDQAYDLGAIIVASAGNHNYTCKNYPSAYARVFSVANTDKDDKLYQLPNVTGDTPCAVITNDCSVSGICEDVLYTAGSTHGTWVDICAPGRRIKSTLPTNDYGRKTGTSMAAPLVAGLCGLILSANPSLTQDQVLNCITSTAVDIDPLNPGFEGLLGAGRIDAHQAVLCASNPPQPEDNTVDVIDCCQEFVGQSSTCFTRDYSFGFGSGAIAFSNVAVEVISKYSITLLPGFCVNAFPPEPGEWGSNPFLAHIGVCLDGAARTNSPIVQIGPAIHNYPNPFANSTEIEYTVDTNAPVSLFVSDITGRRLSTLVNSEEKNIGIHQATFDGQALKSGVYYCTLQIGDRIVTKKMVIAK